MTQTARTVCDPNCHAKPKCGLSATLENGRIIAVEPADYPVPGFENRICLMGRARLEYQYHPERLRKPLKRIGARGEGKWQEISWEEAIDLFIENQRRIAAEYGPRSVVFQQISGAYGLLTRGAPLRYAALTEGTVVRASGIDYGVAKGLEAMFGVPAATYFAAGGHGLDDVKHSNLTIIWGTNPAVTRSVDHVAIKRARDTGTRLVCIDPVRSETAGFCDEWISIRPGSDGALALAMAHEILRSNHIDASFLVQHTNMPFLVNLESGEVLEGADVGTSGARDPLVWCGAAGGAVPVSEARQIELDATGTVRLVDGREVAAASVFRQYADLASDYSPEAAEGITGVDAEVIRALAREYAEAGPAAIRVGYGVDRWYSADLSARAIATLACLCGYIGVSGGGISLISGGKSVPVRGSHFYSPERKRPSVLSMMEQDSAVLEGTPWPVKMECISLGNPYNQVKPNRNQVISRYVEQLEFIAVIDHFMTDTAKQADLVLPACTIFEKTDLVVDQLIQLQQRVVEPEGEAKSDFEIFQMLARAWGVGDQFDGTEAEYIDGILEASTSPLLDGVTFARLEREKVIHPWTSEPPFVGFPDRVFPTASGRVEVYKPELAEHGAELPYFREPVEASPKNPLFAKYPLVLLSSHSRYRIHSTFANLETVKKREPEPVVRVHPEDARARGLADGSVVKLFNDRGHVKIKCCFDETIRPGCTLVREGHWIDQFIEGDPYGLTHDAWSPTAENYAHYDVLVEMEGV